MSDIIFTAEDSSGCTLEITDGAAGLYISISSSKEFDAVDAYFRIEDWVVALEMFAYIHSSKNIPHSVDKSNLKLCIDQEMNVKI